MSTKGKKELRKVFNKIEYDKLQAAKKALWAVEEFRKQITLYIMDVGINSYNIKQIKDMVNKQAKVLSDEMTRIGNVQLEQSFVDGIKIVDYPLRADNVNFILPYLETSIVKTSQELFADLVKGLADDIIKKVNSEVLMGIIGNLTPYEVMKNLETFIPPVKTKKGIRGTAFNRAETIVRTETGRIQNTATRTRMEQIAEKFPDAKKEWLPSNKPTSRPEHMAQANNPIGINEEFIVNGYSCYGPHDPRLPAGEVINCGCSLRTIVMN